MSTPKRLLLVRPSALGDVCRTVPLVTTLQAAYPEATIDWVVQDTFVPAVASHPGVSDAIGFPRRRFGRWYRPSVLKEMRAWFGRLRKRGYDQVIDAQGLARSGLITRLSGGRERIGFANAREMAWLAYNRRHPVDRDLHTVDRMLELLAAEGHEPVVDMALYPPEEDLAWRDQWLAEQGLADSPWLLLAPTARWRCKRWPVDRYLEVARRGLADDRLADRVVVAAAPWEREDVQPLIDELGEAVVLPETTVGRLLALVAGCRLLVCNDSAPLHMAVGCDRPAVAVFGPTDPAKVGPYQRPDDVVQPPGITEDQMKDYRSRADDDSLISQVEVDAVWEKVSGRLGE
ncbi:MAG: glycosyltransferase family 9 protein [Phycisphaeraceae bacterium]|nr:glycosyltransferase family 9 protein [Phycisphaeraceae bacterium]